MAGEARAVAVAMTGAAPCAEPPPCRSRAPDAAAPAAAADRAHWHPKVARLHDYWRSIHPGGALPGRQHFDPLAVHDLLPNIWLLDVQREPFRLRYRLAGTKIIERLGREVTGQWLDEAHPHLASDPAYFGRYRGVVRERAASWRRGPPNFRQDEHVAELENLILPLAADGAEVDMLLILTVRYALAGTEY
jgi:hypothetical protein